MATTKTSSTPQAAAPAAAKPATGRVPMQLPLHYAADLARTSSSFFVGIVVAIAFLLLGGLHEPPIWLLIFMYTALGATALVALLHLPITLVREQTTARAAAWLRALQIAQQVVFVIALAATVGFAIEMSLLFFPAASSAAPATGQAG